MKRFGVGPQLATVATLALSAGALALRLYHLQFQSLWWDEGISLYLARLDLAALTTSKDFGVDLHPPLYHALLAGWVRLAGSSVFAARYLSAALGALAVPLTYYLGRRSFGPAAGLVAALLLAVSPFHVFYSQEARMYPLVLLLGVLSAVLSLRVLERRAARVGELVALTLVNVVGLYTYYYLGLLALAENLAFLAVLVGDALQRAPGAGGESEAGAAGRGSVVLADRSQATERADGASPSATGAHSVWRDESGLRRESAPQRTGGSGLGRAFVPGWLAVQAATALLYLPWLVALWGLFASGAALAVPPETATYRSLAGYLRECLLAFSIGFSRPWPWADLLGTLALVFAGLALARRPRASETWWLLALGVAVPLAGAYAILLRRPFFYPRFVIYVVPLLYALVGGGLARLAGLPEARGSSRCQSDSAPDLRSGSRSPRPAWPALGRPLQGGESTAGTARHADGARLGASRQRSTGALSALGVAVAAAGLFALLLGARQSLASHYNSPRTGYSSADYRVVLRDLAERARPGDAVIATYPWQAGYVAGYLPNAGLTVVSLAGEPDSRHREAAVRLLADHSRVWLLLYSADGRWVAGSLEQALAGAGVSAFVDRFGDSEVRLFATAPAEVVERPAARLGDRIALLSYEVGPTGPRRPGEAVELTLVWQALGRIPADYTVFTHLLGPDGRVWGQLDSPPLQGTRPTGAWSPGEVLIDRYRVPLAADAPSGEYVVEVGLYLPATGQRLPVGRSADEADRVILGKLVVAR